MNSNDLINFFAVISSLVGVLMSVYIYYLKRRADKKMAEVLKNEMENISKQLKTIESSDVNNISLRDRFVNREQAELLSTDKLNLVNKEPIEISIAKLEFLKSEIKLLSNRLNKKDQIEIIRTLDNSSSYSQKNYIDRLIKLSGSTETHIE